jgi:AbrB family looped-hinge helix DNA binding protein
MTKPATTRMSSKGQVVIPERIRQQLRLQAGTQFVVVGDRDVVILKARRAGLRKKDVNAAIAKVRGCK